MDQLRAQGIRRDLVRTYEKVANAFSDTRTDLWEETKFFSEYVREGQKVLDAGCGNGRLLKLFSNRHVIYSGCDNSAKLLEKAQLYSRSYSGLSTTFSKADLIDLPYPDSSFDIVFCVAALHHVPSREYQRKALSEMRRVLSMGGILCMTNWFLSAQPRYVLLQIQQRINNPGLYRGTGFRDFFMPWKRNVEEKQYRYYYAFGKRELQQLVRESGFDLLVHRPSYGGKDWSGRRKKRNIITVARKIDNL